MEEPASPRTLLAGKRMSPNTKYPTDPKFRQQKAQGYEIERSFICHHTIIDVALVIIPHKQRRTPKNAGSLNPCVYKCLTHNKSLQIDTHKATTMSYK